MTANQRITIQHLESQGFTVTGTGWNITMAKGLDRRIICADGSVRRDWRKKAK